MPSTAEPPSSDNDYMSEHAQLLISSYQSYTGKHLIEQNQPDENIYRALFEAPYCVVSHNIADDPIFNYGNQAALKLFELDWSDFINLPSRKSAEPISRNERQMLLANVTKYGFIDNYSGVRISSTGKRFRIEAATVWNITDSNGLYRGQAAVFSQWSAL